MSRVERKEPMRLGDALHMYLKISRLAAPLNTRRVFEAWDEVSGAGKYTLKKFYRGGVLYITTSSSVICSQLKFQKDVLVEKMNARLRSDELFCGDDANTGFIKELKLK